MLPRHDISLKCSFSLVVMLFGKLFVIGFRIYSFMFFYMPLAFSIQHQIRLTIICGVKVMLGRIGTGEELNTFAQPSELYCPIMFCTNFLMQLNYKVTWFIRFAVTILW